MSQFLLKIFGIVPNRR